VAEAVGKCALPFGVSAAAQAGAIAALGVEAQVREQVAQVIGERTRGMGAIRELGVDVPDSQANFVWLTLGELTTRFAEHCEREKVIIRPFAGDGVRVTVASADENDIFLAAARKFPS